MSQGLVVETFDLTKRYDGFVAVDRLNLSIEQGEIFGLLGPNGAGKTTAVLMLMGLTEPSSGSCKVCGFDPFREPLKVKSVSGYLAERVGIYEDLTAEQNLRYITKLNGIPKSESRKLITDALATVGALDYSKAKVKELSRGMRQRVGLAGVLVKKPKIAFLDEPFQGLDPEGKVDLLDLFKRISGKDKMTIFLLTHMLHDLQQVCDRIGIMMKGKMVALGSIEELRSKRGEDWVIEVEAKEITPQLLLELSGLDGVKGVRSAGNIVTVDCKRDLRSEILEVFIQNKASPLDLRAKERSLDEIYISYSKED